MVVLGTKPEYFNAVWVKNEWSRYLALIKNGARKMLIPAYKDMDPYDLPEEFSHLQAQDMSKLGFMQDLIRGIKKILDANVEKTVVHETVIAQEVLSSNLTALLKRGYMSLEDGEWNKADDFFEQALNQNAELTEAYLGKLMAELHVKTKDLLQDYPLPFDESNNYKKAIRFADNQTSVFLTDTLNYINTRNENARRESVYQKGIMIYGSAASEESYIAALSCFESIAGYEDADELAEKCRQKAQEIRDAKEKAIIEKAEKEYSSFCNIHENSKDIWELSKAQSWFMSMNSYKDCAERAKLCQKKIKDIQTEQEYQRHKVMEWIHSEKCTYCGGKFTGLIYKKCSVCGRPKSY